jgi:flagellin
MISLLNNIAALEASNQLQITQTKLQNTLFQLSSGSRINSGADDAAGLAIANGLEANITALTQSGSNASSGVGSLQVADGALAQVTTLLNRAVTLATESANGTVSTQQRTALQAEYSQITSEIDNIGSTTNYNGTAVFGTSQSIFLSDGVSNTTVNTSTNAVSSAGLGMAAGTTQVNTPATSSTAQVSLTGVPANGDQVDVDGTTYTFVTGTPAAAGQVAIVAGNSGQTLLNLAHAINDSGGVPGTDYDVTAANAHVSATVAGNTMTLTALTTGNNNAYTLSSPTDTSGNIVVSGATFTGGAAAGSSTVPYNNDLSSAADAQAALGVINTAIASVASWRGNIGAEINRLQAASNVENVQVQNLTSAEDQIMAANIPQQVTNLSEYSILNQSGISALAQANSAQQSILKLLQ